MKQIVNRKCMATNTQIYSNVWLNTNAKIRY